MEIGGRVLSLILSLYDSHSIVYSHMCCKKAHFLQHYTYSIRIPSATAASTG